MTLAGASTNSISAGPSRALHRPVGPARVVVVGNCQAEMVCKGLRHEVLGNRFEPIYHFVHLDESALDQGKRDLEQCDLLIVQDIRNWEDYPLRSYVPARVETIQFPCLRLASLWPFDGNNGPTDHDAAGRSGRTPFTYFDGLLGQLRQDIPDREQRFEAYRSLQIPSLPNLARLHAFEERRILSVDRQFSCNIGAFVLDNFRSTRLFHTTNHPNGLLYSKLMRFVLKQLGIAQTFPDDGQLDQLESIQVPVHPQVAARLGVDWAGYATPYVFGSRLVDWETYVREYIDFYG